MPVSELVPGHGGREAESRSLAKGIQQSQAALFLESDNTDGIHRCTMKKASKL
jgi:hypothetical protein